MSSRDRESGKRQTPCVMYVRWVPSRTGPVVRARGPAVVHRPQPPWRGAAPRPATAPRPQTASRPTPTTPSPADIICSISLLHTRTCFLSYMLIVYKGVYRRIKVWCTHVGVERSPVGNAAAEVAHDADDDDTGLQRGGPGLDIRNRYGRSTEPLNATNSRNCVST